MNIAGGGQNISYELKYKAIALNYTVDEFDAIYSGVNEVHTKLDLKTLKDYGTNLDEIDYLLGNIQTDRRKKNIV